MSSHSQTVDDDFRVGPRQQTAWGTHMATAFFFGEAGAGLFFVSQFYDFILGMAIGLAMVLFGKGGGHFIHLGQPLRGWRAFAKIHRSWVSRGLLSIAIFVPFGSLYVLHKMVGLLPQPLDSVVLVIALLACLVVMTYNGFAMSHSSAIALWSTGLMPITSLLYGLLNGVLLTMVLGYHQPFISEHAETLKLLQAATLGLLLFAFMTIISMLHAAKFGSEGGRESVDLLLRGEYAAWFTPLVIVIGIVAPAALLAFAAQSYGMLLAIAVMEMIGYYTFRVLILKAGAYDPVMSLTARFFRR